MRKNMLTISKMEPKKGAVMIEKPIPEIGDDDILVKVLATSVCGTDVHIYQWDAWAQSRIPVPQTMGHELAGEVVKVGSRVSHIRVGDIVSAETHIVCGLCEFCMTGRAHICKHTKVLGVDRDGAFAQYIAIPAVNAFINDPSVAPELLCVQEPLGNAVHTVLSGEIIGKSVAVVGVGPIGIMAVDVAKAVGASKVIAIDINEYRLNLARELGADHIINAKETDVVDAVRALTHGAGVDVVCEMSGSGLALNQALTYVKDGGRVSILGIPTKPVEIEVGKNIVFKGLTIHGITGRRMFDTWFQVKALIDSGRLHLDKIITHKLPWEQYEQAMELMESGNCGKIVLMVSHPEEQ